MYTLHTLISQNVFLLLTCLFAQHLNGREGLGAACPLPIPVSLSSLFTRASGFLRQSGTSWLFVHIQERGREKPFQAPDDGRRRQPGGCPLRRRRTDGSVPPGWPRRQHLCALLPISTSCHRQGPSASSGEGNLNSGS